MTHLIDRLLPPNRFLRTLAAIGPAVELGLITQADPHLYQTDCVAFAFGVTFVLWFWVTLIWVVYWVATATWNSSAADRPLGVGLRRVAVAVVTLACLLIYAVGWAAFIQSGRFANIETWRFLLVNVHGLWPYLVEAEPAQLATLLAAVVGFAFGIPCVYHRSLKNETNWSSSAAPRRFLAWLLLTMIMLSFWLGMPQQQSAVRRATRLHVLRFGLHPMFSLYVSHLDGRLAGEVIRCLDTSTLTPLDSVQAQATMPVAIGTEPESVRRSVIFVAIESLRHDTIYRSHQGQEVLPNINQLARSGLEFRRAYAQSTHSDYADLCLVSSLYPLRTPWHHYYGPDDPWPRTLIYDVLKPYGYATAIISSQNEAWGGMSHFLSRPSLDYFYHPETSDQPTIVSEMDPGFAKEVKLGGLVAGKFPDAHTTDEAIRWITQQVEKGKPFFLSMNFQSSHFPYLMPENVPRPFQPHKLDPSVSFVDYPVSETPKVWNAYLNAIHECDRQVGRLVRTLQDLGQLDQTILVITGENGEAFHECQSICHAREPVEPAIHVACVFHAPGLIKPQVSEYPLEHVDLAPTVLAQLGLPRHPNFQGVDVLAADRIPADRKLTFCHVHSPFSQADAVMLAGRWKLTYHRQTEMITLHDVIEDPQEAFDLTSSHSRLANRLQKTLAKWRMQQLAYYRYPEYYLRYFPPRPPQYESDTSAAAKKHAHSHLTGEEGRK